jgi:hypothetical protein
MPVAIRVIPGPWCTPLSPVFRSEPVDLWVRAGKMIARLFFLAIATTGSLLVRKSGTRRVQPLYGSLFCHKSFSRRLRKMWGKIHPLHLYPEQQDEMGEVSPMKSTALLAYRPDQYRVTRSLRRKERRKSFRKKAACQDGDKSSPGGPSLGPPLIRNFR